MEMDMGIINQELILMHSRQSHLNLLISTKMDMGITLPRMHLKQMIVNLNREPHGKTGLDV